MKRDSFIFYKSFYDSIKELNPVDQVKIYNAIFNYEFEGKEEKLTGVAKSIFTLIIPQLEANNQRYINGCRGGRPKKTEIKPKNNQKITKIKANENDNVNDNENDNVNDNDIIITTTNIYSFIEENFNRTLSPIEVEKIDEWLLLFNEDIIKYAIKIAVINNAKRFNYVNKILENWKVAGYKTLQEIKENEKTRKEVNEEKQELFDYNWLDEGDEENG